MTPNNFRVKNGLTVSNGITVQAGGLTVNGNLTVANNTVNNFVIAANGHFGFRTEPGIYKFTFGSASGDTAYFTGQVVANNGIASSTGSFIGTGTNYQMSMSAAANGIAFTTSGNFRVSQWLGSEIFTILNSGNTGIGNTTPAHRLSVAGSIALTEGIYANNSYGSNGQILTSNGTAVYWANASSGGAGGGAITINKSTVTESYTFPADTNGFSVGPVAVANGVTVTVASGQRWVVI